MTDVATVTDRRADDVDPGHPVRSFVAIMTALAALLVLVQWSGAVLPRVASPGSGVSEMANDRWVVQAEIVNEGPFAVEILRIRWPASGGATASAPGLLPVTTDADGYTLRLAPAPFEPFTLEPGGARWIGAEVRTDCGPDYVVGGLGPLELDVRTPLGVRRTLAFHPEGQAVGRSC
jgi:hypothetical protein